MLIFPFSRTLLKPDTSTESFLPPEGTEGSFRENDDVSDAIEHDKLLETLPEPILTKSSGQMDEDELGNEKSSPKNENLNQDHSLETSLQNLRIDSPSLEIDQQISENFLQNKDLQCNTENQLQNLDNHKQSKMRLSSSSLSDMSMKDLLLKPASNSLDSLLTPKENKESDE